MRIVSLVPSLSELTEHLGAGDGLVGVTRWCVWPSDLKSRPGVREIGGPKNPDLVAIRDLRPDLVLANREENEREHVESLARDMEVLVTDVRTVADAETMVLAVGRRLDRGRRAEALARRIRETREEVASSATDGTSFLALVWRKPFLAAGPDTYLSDLLVTAGGVNRLAAPEPRYPVLEDPRERLSEADVVVLPSEPYPFREKHAAEIADLGGRPALADGELLTWYGARTPDGLRHAARILRRM